MNYRKLLIRTDIPVLCYGLRTDFRGELFVGSQYLLAWSDKLVELKTICFCGRKASMVLRLDQAGNSAMKASRVEVGWRQRAVAGFPVCFASIIRKRWARALVSAIQERHSHD